MPPFFKLVASALFALALACPAPVSAKQAITIRADFPGGNVVVERVEDTVVHVAPDLRGGRPWFYWCFEATVAQPGRIQFVFPKRVAGFENGAIGNQGPAISLDSGKNWRWMGKETVSQNSFFYEFKKPNHAVRFAVTIPYLQDDLEQFLKTNSANPHLKTDLLTTSRHGRKVELLRIGKPREGVRPVLITCRHHAAETMASYLFEGFLRAAMSESEAGREFRKQYVLYAIPFVDKDGVEEGDQGKNRRPHDHNRDYGPESIYPEIRAIKALQQKHRFRFALDFHCPTLVMPDHQVIYFVGARNHPPHNFENVSEFAKWIKAGLPDSAPHGPLNWLRAADTPKPMNSHFFAFQEETVMAATLEFPFAPPGKATDPESCRKYGQVMLEAWVNSHFVSESTGSR